LEDLRYFKWYLNGISDDFEWNSILEGILNDGVTAGGDATASAADTHQAQARECAGQTFCREFFWDFPAPFDRG